MHDDSMKGIVLLGGAAFLGWYLYEHGYLSQFIGAPSGTGVSSTPQPGAGTSTTSTQAQQQQVISTPSTLQRIMAAMVKNNDDPTGLHTVWEYNYYYFTVTGVQGPSPDSILPNDANSTTHKIDLNTWWAGMNKMGLSGLGLIARMNPQVNYYSPGRAMGMKPLASELTYRVLGG